MRIGELSERTGVSPRSLRYYEAKGLLQSARGSGGQREFAAPAADRVALIQHLFAAGLVTADIRPIIDAVERGRSAPELVTDLELRRSDLAARLSGLTAALRRLDEVLAVVRSPEEHCAPAALA